MSEEREQEIRERLEAATPGPWTFNDSTDPRGHKGEFRAPPPHNGFMLVGAWTNGADASVMAHAPDDLAYLLSHLSSVREEREGDRYALDGQAKLITAHEARVASLEAALEEIAAMDNGHAVGASTGEQWAIEVENTVAAIACRALASPESSPTNEKADAADASRTGEPVIPPLPVHGEEKETLA